MTVKNGIFMGFEWTEEKAVWTIDGETVRILNSTFIRSMAK